MLIEVRIDHETNIHNNHAELFKSIKEYALTYQELRHNVAKISNSFRVFFNCKQCNKESLQDCTKHFKVLKEILESYLGRPTTIEKIVKNHSNYEEID